jgi:MurNAc alpha-1-phosphate uridylyltransferase
VRAFILAAGYGKRLRPFTEEEPKALVKVQGIPMIEIVVERLKKYGITDIVVNLHHYGSKIEKYIREKDFFGISINFSYEDELLDTGGAIKHAKNLLNDGRPVILHNVDILSDIDLNSFINYFNHKDADVLLAVKNRKSTRYLLFDENYRLQGWKNLKTEEKILSTSENHSSLIPMAFSGIHIIGEKALERIFNFPENKFSITKFYLQDMKELKIFGYPHNNNFVMDLGKIENLEIAQYLDLRKFL